MQYVETISCAATKSDRGPSPFERLRRIRVVRAAESRAERMLRAMLVFAASGLLGTSQAQAAINAQSAVTSLTSLGKAVVQVIQIGLVVAGMASIGYGLIKWRKKGSDAGGDQVETRQILMPIFAGAAMICIWAVVEFVVTAGGGSTSDIGRTQTF